MKPPKQLGGANVPKNFLFSGKPLISYNYMFVTDIWRILGILIGPSTYELRFEAPDWGGMTPGGYFRRRVWIDTSFDARNDSLPVKDALAFLDQATRLNPFHPQYHYGIKAGAYFLQRRYQDAIDAYKLVPGLSSPLRSRLAACCAQTGLIAEAKQHVRALLEELPGAGASYYVNERFVYEREEDREHFREGLIKAGLPE